jgi:hypothetical protein
MVLIVTFSLQLFIIFLTLPSGASTVTNPVPENSIFIPGWMDAAAASFFGQPSGGKNLCPNQT